jgi:hypothetical protein
MSSIFDLKTSVNELSSANQGTSRLTYDQIAPTRDVTSGNFPNGAIYIRWQVSGEKWWIPARSYLRMRCSLTKGDGTQFRVADKIAPSMNLMANLFQNAELRINDKTVSRIPNYVSQIEALEQRLSKSSAQMNGLFASTNFMQSSFVDRQAQICSDGNILNTGVASRSAISLLGLADNAGLQLTNGDAIAYTVATGIMTFIVASGADVRQIFKSGDIIDMTGNVLIEVIGPGNGPEFLECKVAQSVGDTAIDVQDATLLRIVSTERNIKDFELTWTPCLSLFKLNHAMPSGKYELVLNPFPQSVYQLQAVESKNPLDFTSSVADPSKVAAGDADKIRFNVVDFYLYCNTVDGPRADNMSYLLDLNQTSCQQETVKNASFAQRNYDISPSTYALTVAFQDGRCFNDTRIPSSIFKCYSNNYVPDKELALNRMYISYAGMQRPSPDADPSFNTGVDRTVQRYVDTMIENGAYYDSGGAESIQEYHERGSYYYFSWAKDGTDRSSRVAIHAGFDDAQFVVNNPNPTLNVNNANCLLFAHSKQVGKITVQDGMVTDVAIEDA